MKYLFFLIIMTAILSGCSSSVTKVSISNSQSFSNNENGVKKDITLRQDFYAEFVGTVAFTLTGKCNDSKAIMYARAKNLAHELGSIVSRQIKSDTISVTTITEYDSTKRVTTEMNGSSASCEYSALGFKYGDRKYYTNEIISKKQENDNE